MGWYNLFSNSRNIVASAKNFRKCNILYSVGTIGCKNEDVSRISRPRKSNIQLTMRKNLPCKSIPRVPGIDCPCASLVVMAKQIRTGN